MPSIFDFDELDLTGIEIGPVTRKGEILRAKFGGGFGAKAVVGPGSGLWGWEVTSDCLPDDDTYDGLINGKPRYQYYQDFWQEHTTGSKDVFVIDFRGRKYHASFVEDSIGGQMHTYDLFSLEGVRIEMRRVVGIYYRSDGSVFDPRELPLLWAWGRAEDADAFLDSWTDISGNDHELTLHDDVEVQVDIQNGRPVVSLNPNAEAPSPGGYITGSDAVKVYGVVMVVAMHDATFPVAAGLLTGQGGSSQKILVGSTGTTKFASQSFGSGFQYAKDGTNYIESNQQAPMSDAFSVVSITSTSGITLDGIQMGKSRTTTNTFLEGYIGEYFIIGTDILDTPGAGVVDHFIQTDLADLIGFARRGWDTPLS